MHTAACRERRIEDVGQLLNLIIVRHFRVSSLPRGVGFKSPGRIFGHDGNARTDSVLLIFIAISRISSC